MTAQHDLGPSLFRGDGAAVNQNRKLFGSIEACRFKLSADQGHAPGQFSYGLCATKVQVRHF
jgi:hypothetical protein